MMNVDEFIDLIEDSTFDIIGDSRTIDYCKVHKKSGKAMNMIPNGGSYGTTREEVKSYLERAIRIKGTDKRPRTKAEQVDLDNYPIEWHYKEDQDWYEDYINQIRTKTLWDIE